MEQEERNNKKKARIEDFGGVQNAPSSFFNESIDDKLFSDSFVKSVKFMETLPDNMSNVSDIITLKSDYDSRVLDLGGPEKNPTESITKQFEKLVKNFAEKETSSVHSRSYLTLSELSRQMGDESYFVNKPTPKAEQIQADVSMFFKKSSQHQKELEKQKNHKVSKLKQYNEHSDGYNLHNYKAKSPAQNNPIELISNHYNHGKNNRGAGHQEYSTKPSTDNKIVVSSNTVIKRSTDPVNPRTTDSSELVRSVQRRESSEQKKKKSPAS